MTKLPKDPYQLLKLYPTIQQMILDRTLEILTPYQEIDNNIGGGSAGFISNPTEQTVVALCEDELLEELRHVEIALHKTELTWRDYAEIYSGNLITIDEFVGTFDAWLNRS